VNEVDASIGPRRGPGAIALRQEVAVLLGRPRLAQGQFEVGEHGGPIDDERQQIVQPDPHDGPGIGQAFDRRAWIVDLEIRKARCVPQQAQIKQDPGKADQGPGGWAIAEIVLPVALPAPQIVGGFLWDKNRKVLSKLARSKSLWKRRIAVLATFHFIKRGETTDSLKIASILLSDTEDLIHKAVGWMLREVGKRNLHNEEEFLKQHYRRMPRTMLRYAVERFPEPKRQRYLKGKI